MDPREKTLGDAAVHTAEATTSLLELIMSPAEHGCHAVHELYKLRSKWFGIQIHL